MLVSRPEQSGEKHRVQNWDMHCMHNNRQRLALIRSNTIFERCFLPEPG
ncbi:hypothetical protein J2852_004106 [Azospirillum soli]|nr:hypothetical protein [Azospirillum soli]